MTPDPLALELWALANRYVKEDFLDAATRILARARAEEADHLAGEYDKRATSGWVSDRGAQSWLWAWEIARNRAAELRKVSDGIDSPVQAQTETIPGQSTTDPEAKK